MPRPQGAMAKKRLQILVGQTPESEKTDWTTKMRQTVYLTRPVESPAPSSTVSEGGKFTAGGGSLDTGLSRINPMRDLTDKAAAALRNRRERERAFLEEVEGNPNKPSK